MTACPKPKEKAPSCPDNGCVKAPDNAGYSLSSVIPDYSADTLNLPLDDLCGRMGQFLNEPVYAYVIDSIRLDDGQYQQTGSAPNFQDGVITLCTCKHWMRTFKPVEDWTKGAWIAGFTGLTHTNGQNLVYLIRIGESFGDFCALWKNSKFIAGKARLTKSATHNPHGDLYEPLSGNTAEPLHPDAYHTPCDNHDHYAWWKNEVNTKSYGKTNPSALLIGNPEHSYLWQAPELKSSHKMTQGQATEKMADFLSLLIED